MGEAKNNPMAQWMEERRKATAVVNAAVTASVEQQCSSAAFFTVMVETSIRALLKMEVMQAMTTNQPVDFSRPEKFVTEMLKAYRAELVAQIAGGSDDANGTGA